MLTLFVLSLGVTYFIAHNLWYASHQYLHIIATTLRVCISKVASSNSCQIRELKSPAAECSLDVFGVFHSKRFMSRQKNCNRGRQFLGLYAGLILPAIRLQKTKTKILKKSFNPHALVCSVLIYKYERTPTSRIVRIVWASVNSACDEFTI